MKANFDHATATKLAVDSQIEERAIPHLAVLVAKEACRPDLPAASARFAPTFRGVLLGSGDADFEPEDGRNAETSGVRNIASQWLERPAPIRVREA